jgi:hypothetical protein
MAALPAFARDRHSPTIDPLTIGKESAAAQKREQSSNPV